MAFSGLKNYVLTNKNNNFSVIYLFRVFIFQLQLQFLYHNFWDKKTKPFGFAHIFANYKVFKIFCFEKQNGHHFETLKVRNLKFNTKKSLGTGMKNTKFKNSTSNGLQDKIY